MASDRWSVGGRSLATIVNPHSRVVLLCDDRKVPVVVRLGKRMRARTDTVIPRGFFTHRNSMDWPDRKPRLEPWNRREAGAVSLEFFLPARQHG